MTRFCVGCRRPRELRDFDLDGQVCVTCLECQREGSRTEEKKDRAALLAQVDALEHERRVMIAALVKIDVKIAELRAQLSSSSSAAFKRVDPSSVFEDD